MKRSVTIGRGRVKIFRNEVFKKTKNELFYFNENYVQNIPVKRVQFNNQKRINM